MQQWRVGYGLWARKKQGETLWWKLTQGAIERAGLTTCAGAQRERKRPELRCRLWWRRRGIDGDIPEPCVCCWSWWERENLRNITSLKSGFSADPTLPVDGLTLTWYAYLLLLPKLWDLHKLVITWKFSIKCKKRKKQVNLFFLLTALLIKMNVCAGTAEPWKAICLRWVTDR